MRGVVLRLVTGFRWLIRSPCWCPVPMSRTGGGDHLRGRTRNRV